MDALGVELAERQEQLFAQIEKDGLPKIKLTTMENAKV
jgi:hypothetical protein